MVLQEWTSQYVWAKTEGSFVELPWFKWAIVLWKPISVQFLLNLDLFFRLSFEWHSPWGLYSLPNGFRKPSSSDDCVWTYVYNRNVPCPRTFRSNSYFFAQYGIKCFITYNFCTALYPPQQNNKCNSLLNADKDQTWKLIDQL